MSTVELIFPVGLAAVGLWLLYCERRLIALGLRSYSWARADGVIVDCIDKSFVTRGGSAETGIRDIRWRDQDYSYEYSVQGEVYRSDNYCFGGWSDRRKASYRIGESVTVYFDPRSPSTAVLKPGLTCGAAFGSFPILGAVLYLLVALLRGYL
jgi:hypothetical protein